MGIAILIEDADFSINNIGKVTPIYNNYTLLDFIATKSTNYLDTGIIFSNIGSIELDFWLNDASQESYLFGSSDASRVSNQINVYNRCIYCLTEFRKSGGATDSGEWYQSGSILDSKVFYKAEYSKQQYLKLDGVSISQSSSSTGVGSLDRTIYMFNSNKANGTFEDKPGLVGIKSLTFRDTANLVIFNVVPVLSNNIPYYYNTITGELLSIEGNNEIWYKPVNSETLIQYQ